jgi:phosphomannomutase
MTLIRSISGIRGTIGGKPSTGLTPPDIVLFVTAFVNLMRERTGKERIRVVVGRDARISGPMVNHLVTGTIQACGADVFDLGLSTTPTVEMAVKDLEVDAGIILTASHNPEQWNALKLLNEKGEFLSAADGESLLEIARGKDLVYAGVHQLGEYSIVEGQLERHIEAILQLPLVDARAIKEKGFKVGIDAINSSGSVALPLLLQRLGVEQVNGINMEPNGRFAHDPEPLKENLQDICRLVSEKKLDLAFVVDPDVDRLAIVMENGELFGEEYTLVAVADYVLQNNPGNTVSNLSSTRALKDVTEKYGGNYFASAVGEVNVVEKMKATDAVIGGEGNGGVIYPDLHYGRDALVGIALFLTWLARSGKTCSELRKTYPDYFISKNKIQLEAGADPDLIIQTMLGIYKEHPANTADGLRIDFDEGWVHLRKSNTEPIIRVYAESADQKAADNLARKFMDEVLRISC